MIRSPFPDIEIPDMPFTEFVLERADERGDKAAIIDGPTGRTITYPELVESVRGLAAGLAERGFGKGDVFAHYAPNLPEYAVAFHGVATAGGVNTTANPMLTEDELVKQLVDSGARLLVTVPELLEKATAAARRSRVEEIFVYGEAAGAAPFASLVKHDAEPPRGGDRSRQRSDRAPVLERHHRAPQGRDADPPKPGREHRPVHASRCHAQERRRAGRRARDRRAAVLSHLRARRTDEHPAVPRRDGRDDAAFRPGSVPADDPGLPGQPGMGGAADRPRAGQASARRRVRPVEPRVHELGRRAAVRRARGGVRQATRLSHAAGLRADRDEPGDPLGDRQARGHDAGLDRPRRPEHRVPDRRRRDRAGRPGRRARRAVHPRPAGDEGLPQQSRGDRARDRRRRLVPHRRRRSARRGRLAVDRRPDQGADQVQGLPDRPGRARGAAAHPPRDHRRCRDPGPRRGGRRDPEGVRRRAATRSPPTR